MNQEPIKENPQDTKAFLRGLFSRTEMIFGLSFLGVFFVTILLLYIVGLIPTEFLFSANDKPTVVETIQSNTFEGLGLEDRPLPVDTASNTSKVSEKASVPAEAALHIEAPSISLNSTIQNPLSTDYRTLDNALAKGAVRYPGSGTVEEGNMFIFGHSTGYKMVNNKAYQVFNNIHLLKSGDEITISTAHTKYVYKVQSVKLVDSREALVDFTVTDRMLTLSTCNSFGQTTDRYVVKASFDHTIDI